MAHNFRKFNLNRLSQFKGAISLREIARQAKQENVWKFKIRWKKRLMYSQWLAGRLAEMMA